MQKANQTCVQTNLAQYTTTHMGKRPHCQSLHSVRILVVQNGNQTYTKKVVIAGKQLCDVCDRFCLYHTQTGGHVLPQFEVGGLCPPTSKCGGALAPPAPLVSPPLKRCKTLHHILPCSMQDYVKCARSSHLMSMGCTSPIVRMLRVIHFTHIGMEVQIEGT